MMYPNEALTYTWFINYFLALAIITIPFAAAYILSGVVEQIIKYVRKKKKGNINGKENDVNSR